MSLSEDVKKAIEKDLPNLVGKELQKYITEAEDLKATYSNLLEENTRTRKLVDAQEQELAMLRGLNLSRLELAEKERDLKVVLAEAKAANSELLVRQAFDMVGMVFRNQTISKTIFESGSKYNSGCNESISKEHTETTTTR